MKRSKLSIALAVALVLCLALPAVASASMRARVRMSYSAGSLYLRSEPDRDSEAVGTVHNGDSITVLDYGNIWSRIKTESGKKGYIKNLYIDDGDTDYAAGTKYVNSYTAYTTAGVNLRSGASTGTSVIRVLSKGTKVSVRGKNGSFYLVQTKDGTQGYISNSYVSTSGSSSGGSSSGGSSSGTTKTVTGSYVNVREGGGMSYDVVAVLSRGTKVTVRKVGSYWTLIRCGSIEGWMKNVYLS